MICCFYLILFALGPRAAMLLWWIVGRNSWDKAWEGISWFWEVLGIIFAPWTALMFLAIGGKPVEGWDWLWLGLGALVDLMSWANFFKSRNDVPEEYSKYVPYTTGSK